jgi:hypothetical protein
MEQKEQQEKLEGLKKLIIANSKDASFAKKQIAELISTQKQLDIEPVEIIVPSDSVTDEIDFGADKIQRCAKGFLYTAKGGMQTLVSWEMQGVCDMIEMLFKFRDSLPSSDEEKTTREVYTSAVLYVLEAPIYASLDPKLLYDIATALKTTFNEVANDLLNLAKKKETEEDYKFTIEQKQQMQVLDQLVNQASDLPNYDADSDDEES